MKNKRILRSEFEKMLKDDFIRQVGVSRDYYVSRCGDVYSVKFMNINGRINKLTNSLIGSGYLKVGLHIDGKNVGFQVHRLVAQAFIQNPKKFPEVNHKDEIKTNNDVDNLEWCTRSYNASYGNRTKNLRKRVAQITPDGRTVKVWNSVADASRAGYINKSIIRCANGKASTHRCYMWKYV